MIMSPYYLIWQILEARAEIKILLFVFGPNEYILQNLPLRFTDFYKICLRWSLDDVNEM